MLTVFITGGNKGIGRALSTEFLAKGHRVISSSRKKNTVPDGIHEIAPLDVTDSTAIDSLSQRLREISPHVDIVIHCAGILGLHRGYGSADKGLNQLGLAEEMDQVYKTNCIGPLMISKQIMPMLSAADAPRLVHISSAMGSCGARSGGGYYAYRMTKAALNMATVTMATDFEDLTVVSMHPGWVQTDMGGDKAPMSAEESASKLCTQILSLEHEQSGTFLDYAGNAIPW